MSVNIEKYHILYYNYIVYNKEKNMISINADKPITKSEEDVLGRKKFVENLTNVLTSYEDTNSLTIGLYGKWGSGKTSIINLTTTKLKEAKYKVIHFNPWNFKGQDELIQCFFKEFYNQLDMVDYHKLFTKLGNLFKRRNNLHKSNVHFHGLRHTFSNMLFEMNENPKVIQQLLGHRDVKTTITVYNSVNSDYVREATDRLNTKIQEQQKEKEIEIEQAKEPELTDEEIDRMIKELERKKKRKEKDFEM